MQWLGAGGEARAPIIAPTEQTRYESYRLAVLANAIHSVVVIDDVGGVTSSVEFRSNGTTSQLRPLEEHSFAPEWMKGDGRCQIAILPAYGGPASDAPYIARCAISTQAGASLVGLTSTSFGWLHLSDQGEIEHQELWQGEGGDHGQLPGYSGPPEGGATNRLCGFGAEVDVDRYPSDADRLVALYDAFDDSVRAVRGDTGSWLVRADGCGEVAATCLRAEGLGRSHVATAVGPLGMRVERSDLIILDAASIQRMKCED